MSDRRGQRCGQRPGSALRSSPDGCAAARSRDDSEAARAAAAAARQRRGAARCSAARLAGRAPPRAPTSAAPLTVAVVLVRGLDRRRHRPHAVARSARTGRCVAVSRPRSGSRPISRSRTSSKARSAACMPASSRAPSAAERVGVGVEQRGMRVVAGQQLHQQLVQVEAAEERGTGEHRRGRRPTRRRAGSGSRAARRRRVAAERDRDALERQEHARSCEYGRLAPFAATASRPCSRVKRSRIRLDSLQS